jgi:hypothetical protein
MTKKDSTNISRRNLLKGAAMLPLAAVIPMLAKSRDAMAGNKAPKAAMRYQDKPNNGADCSTCMHFEPGKSASAMGTCAVVAGEISPKGWCLAYAKKS